jgi:hypothetical protein
MPFTNTLTKSLTKPDIDEFEPHSLKDKESNRFLQIGLNHEGERLTA